MYSTRYLFDDYINKTFKKFNIKLVDLKSRFKSFLSLGISLPTDDLLKVIITSTFLTISSNRQ